MSAQVRARRVDYDLDKAKGLLDQVAERLSRCGWFKKDWLVSVHYFPPAPAKPESVSMHVYKDHWFNEDRQGIHFETQLSAEQFRKQTIPVMLHIFHTPTVPGTKIKRIKVSKPIVDDAFDTISSWDGYVFRVGKYGTQPFTCTIEFTFETLVDQLETEFSRMCKELGPLIDRTLRDVLEE